MAPPVPTTRYSEFKLSTMKSYLSMALSREKQHLHLLIRAQIGRVVTLQALVPIRKEIRAGEMIPEVEGTRHWGSPKKRVSEVFQRAQNHLCNYCNC